jgi:menaquinone-specific isochorismate synthase
MNDRTLSSKDSEKQPRNPPDPGGAGVPPVVFLPLGGSLKIRNRRLPHWEIEHAVYFVTFRLADSLPKKALQEIDSERRDILETASQKKRALSASERKRIGRLNRRTLESTLDTGAGKCFLLNRPIAQTVVNALREFDGSRYRLFAWCVMPNHVHVLFQCVENGSLASILHSWKSYSAKVANQMLERNGEFWQREYYDHLIRKEAEFDRAMVYIKENPSKAGLTDWPWVWAWK